MSTLAYKLNDQLYLNITDRCSLDCVFCPKNRGRPVVGEHDLSLDHRPSAEEVLASFDRPDTYREVVFSGFGEPTMRLNPLLQIAKSIKQQGGKVRIVTDGLADIIHANSILPDLAQWVDSLTISMNAQDEATYDAICRPALPGSFHAMLAFLTEAPRFIPRVEATIIGGIQGVDLAACQRLADRCNVPLRVRTLDQF